ncbi:MAG: hypothetical protein ACRYGK_15720, partial [Janthinobacterium lividum]
ASLAFNTTMTRKEAIGVLNSTPVATSGVPNRSARNPSLGAGAPVVSSKQAVANSWDAALQKAAPRR